MGAPAILRVAAGAVAQILASDSPPSTVLNAGPGQIRINTTEGAARQGGWPLAAARTVSPAPGESWYAYGSDPLGAPATVYILPGGNASNPLDQSAASATAAPEANLVLGGGSPAVLLDGPSGSSSFALLDLRISLTNVAGTTATETTQGTLSVYVPGGPVLYQVLAQLTAAMAPTWPNGSTAAFADRQPLYGIPLQANQSVEVNYIGFGTQITLDALLLYAAAIT